jgi:SAM-dependent methyltransferase
VQDCRNCGSQNLKDLGFIGEVAPFFLKRVLNMEVGASRARHPLRLLARRICAVPQRLFTKIYGSSVYVEMQICLDCSFVQTKYAFADDAIKGLYSDYRSATYNQDRIRYEPSYAALAPDVGASETEIQTRVGGLTSWLAGKIDSKNEFSMLDFGGSDGRFLPRVEGQKFVFEISDTPPMEGIVKIDNERELTTYSYVQVAHVLEHVPEPLALLKRILRFVKPSGYLYIEVPQDLTDVELAELKSGKHRHGLSVHEHINVFCIPAITNLVKAAGFDPLSIESVPVDLGWSAGTNIRALCQPRKGGDRVTA